VFGTLRRFGALTTILAAAVATIAPASASATTFTVTTLADQDNGSCPIGGPCSLRDAITAANAAAGADIVQLPAGTITLAAALPPITGPIELRGAGMIATQVVRGYAELSQPLLDFTSATEDCERYLVTGLTLRGAHVNGSGGAIRMVMNGANSAGCPGIGAIEDASRRLLRVEDVRFQDNYADLNGGAISVGSTVSQRGVTLRVANSVFVDNTAGTSGGAISFENGSSTLTDQQAGAVLLVERSSFVRNRANSAGAIRAERARRSGSTTFDVRLDSVLLDGNDARSGTGGAVLVSPNAVDGAGAFRFELDGVTSVGNVVNLGGELETFPRVAIHAAFVPNGTAQNSIAVRNSLLLDACRLTAWSGVTLGGNLYGGRSCLRSGTYGDEPVLLSDQQYMTDVLSPRQDVAGTPLRAPRPGSPALGFGSLCTQSGPDLLGNPRFASCASGAVEPIRDTTLAATRQTPSPVTGQEVRYGVALANAGAATAPTTVTVTSPGNVVRVGSSCSGTGTVSCDVGAIGGGAIGAFTVGVQPASAGAHDVTIAAEVGGDGLALGPSDYQDSFTAAAPTPTPTTPAPDPLRLDVQRAAGPVLAAAPASYAVAIANRGTAAAPATLVVDAAGAVIRIGSACSGTGRVTCALGSVAAGGVRAVGVSVTAPTIASHSVAFTARLAPAGSAVRTAAASDTFTATGPAAHQLLRVAAAPVRVDRAGRAGVRVSCDSRVATRCTGRVELLGPRRIGISAPFSVPRGSSRVVRVPLTAATRTRLARSGTLRVRARITAGRAGTAAVRPAASTVTLTLRR
jgi:CSLREA domain-containing protein